MVFDVRAPLWQSVNLGVMDVGEFRCCFSLFSLCFRIMRNCDFNKI
jgi:hypothetical protein